MKLKEAKAKLKSLRTKRRALEDKRDALEGRARRLDDRIGDLFQKEENLMYALDSKGRIARTI